MKLMKSTPLRHSVSVLLFSLLFLSASGQRNSASIKGRIISADGNPAFVTVELKSLKRIAVTDNDGNFRFERLPALQDTLIITSIGSRTYSQPIALQKNEAVNLGDVHLSFNVRQLQDVEVKGRLAHSYKSDYTFFGNKTETPIKDIPQSISTVTKELIKDKMEFTLKDAMDEVAGVNPYSGFDEYTIRGFRAENSRDINGLRGYNTTYTSAMLVNIERVEVIKGPTATLYGNCSSNGHILGLMVGHLVVKYECHSVAGRQQDIFRCPASDDDWGAR